MTSIAGEDRAAYVQALVELAAFLAVHPDIPGPNTSICVLGTDAEQIATMNAVAAAFGSPIKTDADGVRLTVSAKLGPLQFEYFACLDAAMDHYYATSYSQNVRAGQLVDVSA
jgi:hypothetical protein